MCFGLGNAPATFQKATDVILATIKWWYALVYTADIIIFLNTPEEHPQHIEEVLKLLNNAEMTIKTKKYSTLSKKIGYLGRVIAPSKLQIATRTTKAIKALQYFTTLLEL